MMQVLIIGSGGREHALAWKAQQSPLVSRVFVAPGNAGTAQESEIENLAIATDDLPALLNWAQTHAIDLTIVGPEAPLAAGIVDAFEAAGLACFGPRAAAAQLETSKTFSKAFMQRHHIPTAAYADFTDLSAAQAYIRQQPLPLVIKADGLAAGKGVIIAHDQTTALDAAADMLQGAKFGNAGRRIIVEAFLEGEEASFIILANGETFLPMATSQDHKRRDDGDQGPNTGGMGAYSPTPIISDDRYQETLDRVIRPTLAGLKAEGLTYRGFLYAGLMFTETGVSVLEFNCRFGDPETQPILMRLQSDLVAHCAAACENRLEKECIQWDDRPALGVVMAAGGYPDHYEKGAIIHGTEGLETPDIKVFHAGTGLTAQGQICTQGGRVLCVTALGDTLQDAQKKAYEAAQKIHWTGSFYRRDIGHRALKKPETQT